MTWLRAPRAPPREGFPLSPQLEITAGTHAFSTCASNPIEHSTSGCHVGSRPHELPVLSGQLQRWQTETEPRDRAGSALTVHWKIGSVPICCTVQVVEFGNARDLAWTGITGMTVRGGSGCDGGPGQTKVTFRLTVRRPAGCSA